MKQLLAVGLGGGIGSLLRASVYGMMPSMVELWTVNLLGSMVLGFVAGRFQGNSVVFRLFVSTGLLGSFTTFSAFSAEWFRLLNTEFLAGIIFAVSMTACSVAAAAIGLWIGRKRGVR